MEPTLGIVIEPPTSVANSLLDAARRFAADLEERGARVSWVPPQFYSAPLVEVRAPPGPAADVVADAVRSVMVRSEECPVQFMPFAWAPIEGDADRVVVHSLVSLGSGEPAGIADAVVRALEACGLEASVVSPLRVAIAVATGTNVEAVKELLGEPKGLSGDSGRREPEAILDAGQAPAGLAAEGEAGACVEAGVPAGNEPDARSDPAQQTRSVRTGPRDTPIAGWLLGGLCLASVTVADQCWWVPERVRFLPLRRLGSRREG